MLLRVARRLEHDRLYLFYLEVFSQQERDGIIDIFVSPRWFKEYVWIPHRLVISQILSPPLKFNRYSIAVSRLMTPFLLTRLNTRK